MIQVILKIMMIIILYNKKNLIRHGIIQDMSDY